MSPTKPQTLATAATVVVIAGSLLGSVFAVPLSGSKQLLRRGQNQCTLASRGQDARVATGGSKPDSKKRDLADVLDVLEARDVDELIKLFRRGGNTSKVAGNIVKNTADAVMQNAAQGAFKKAVTPDQQPLPQEFKDALRKG